MKHRIITMLLVLVLVCSLCAVALVGCSKDKAADTGSGNNDADQNVPAKQVATSYVALDINPSVELILDENNKVMNVRGLNGDANVLLQGEDGIIGADVNVAVEKLGSLSAKLGYINENNNVINVNVSSALDTAAGNSLKSDIEVNVKKGAEGENPSIEVSIKSDGEFSLKREYEAFIAAHPEYSDIDIAQYRMMAEALAADAKLKVEEAAKMTKAELIEFISDAREDAVDEALNLLPEAEKKALEVAEDAYELLIEKMEVNAYLHVQLKEQPVGTALDITKMNDHIKYIVYKNFALALEDINDAIEAEIGEVEEVLNGEEVKAIFDELVANGIIKAEDLAAEQQLAMDENGKYTLDSIEAYLDIKLKNANEAVSEAIEDTLDKVLDDAETRFEQLEEELESVLPESVKTKLANIGKEISDRLTAELDLTKFAVIKDAIDNTINEIINLNPAEMTVELLENLEDEAEDKADYHEEKIVEQMSETEGLLDKVDEYKASLLTDSKVAEMKANFDAKLKEAVDKAVASLEAEKAERANQNA